MKTLNMETKGTAALTAWLVGLFSAFIINITNLTLSEWSAIIAIISCLLSVLITWYYKRKESKARIDYYESKNNKWCDL